MVKCFRMTLQDLIDKWNKEIVVWRLDKQKLWCNSTLILSRLIIVYGVNMRTKLNIWRSLFTNCPKLRFWRTTWPNSWQMLKLSCVRSQKWPNITNKEKRRQKVKSQNLKRPSWRQAWLQNKQRKVLKPKKRALKIWLKGIRGWNGESRRHTSEKKKPKKTWKGVRWRCAEWGKIRWFLSSTKWNSTRFMTICSKRLVPLKNATRFNKASLLIFQVNCVKKMIGSIIFHKRLEV